MAPEGGGAGPQQRVLVGQGEQCRAQRGGLVRVLRPDHRLQRRRGELRRTVGDVAEPVAYADTAHAAERGDVARGEGGRPGPPDDFQFTCAAGHRAGAAVGLAPHEREPLTARHLALVQAQIRGALTAGAGPYGEDRAAGLSGVGSWRPWHHPHQRLDELGNTLAAQSGSEEDRMEGAVGGAGGEGGVQRLRGRRGTVHDPGEHVRVHLREGADRRLVERTR